MKRLAATLASVRPSKSLADGDARNARRLDDGSSAAAPPHALPRQLLARAPGAVRVLPARPPLPGAPLRAAPAHADVRGIRAAPARAAAILEALWRHLELEGVAHSHRLTLVRARARLGSGWPRGGRQLLRARHAGQFAAAAARAAAETRRQPVVRPRDAAELHRPARPPRPAWTALVRPPAARGPPRACLPRRPGPAALHCVAPPAGAVARRAHAGREPRCGARPLRRTCCRRGGAATATTAPPWRRATASRWPSSTSARRRICRTFT